MRASIVPQRNKWRRHITIGALGVLATAAAAAVAAAIGASFATDSSAAESFPGTERAIATAPEGAEPGFSPIDHELLWADDFDDAPRMRAPEKPGDAGRLGRYLTLGDPFVRHDPVGGVDRSGAVRMDWYPAAGSARCRDDSRMLEAWFEPADELFIQFEVRYTPGFVFDWRRHGRCTGNAKKLFLLWPREGSRFVFISENGTLGIGSDYDQPLFAQNRGHALQPADLADGRWHRITFHIRQGSASDRADGFVRGWIDGVQRWEHLGVVSHNAGGYYLFKFPATFNQGSPVAQSEWVDALRLWRPR